MKKIGNSNLYEKMTVKELVAILRKPGVQVWVSAKITADDNAQVRAVKSDVIKMLSAWDSDATTDAVFIKDENVVIF